MMVHFFTLVSGLLPLILLIVKFLKRTLLLSKCLSPLLMLLTIVAIVTLDLLPNALQHRIIVGQVSIDDGQVIVALGL